jgi:ketosteroid isomerase-like protein
LNKVKSNDVILKSIKLDGVEVHQYENVAVVTGRMLIKGQMREKEISYQELFTHTFEQRKNQWLLVAAHSSYMGVLLQWTESYPTSK